MSPADRIAVAGVRVWRQLSKRQMPFATCAWYTQFYGAENSPLRNSWVHAKRTKNNIERFGAECVFVSPKMAAAAKAVWQERFGQVQARPRTAA